MKFAVQFRIPFFDPFGRRYYVNGCLVSNKSFLRGQLIHVRERVSGVTSPYLAEVLQLTETLRDADSFRFVEGEAH